MRLRKLTLKVAKATALGIYLILAILPLAWMVITSLKNSTEIYTWPLTYWPKTPSFASYRKLFMISHFGKYFLNSLGVTIASSTGAMIISTFGGFALSRFKSYRGKKAILLGLYFTQTIPTFILMVPLFFFFSRWGLVNRLSSLSVVYISTVIAFSTIMAKSFFDRIPKSLEEAAMIDGCSIPYALFHIIIPVALPGIIAIFSFAFINIWNELFLAVMLLLSDKKMTVPVALNSFISKTGISWDVMSAGIVVALLPTMIVFGIGQKYIVAGLTDGSVKG